ncbi:MAG TPA: condensation domain-containing protein, partial [Pseudonocardiaceae bacterium]
MTSLSAIPLSFAQHRLWFADRMEGASTTYNTAHFVRLTGALDTAALATALADVIGRHEPLRTVFPEVDGEPYQHVRPAPGQVPLTAVPVSGADLAAALDRAAGHTFDLATEPPFRAELFAVAPGEHVLLVVMHHIATDGWSWGRLLRDIGTAYGARRAGHAPDWPPLPVRYADYTLWQRELLGGATGPDSVLAQELGYWRAALAGLPDEVPIAADRSRHPSGRRTGAAVPLAVDAAVHQQVREIAASCGATPFMVVQAGLAVLLARSGAGTDVPIGTAVAGRGDEALDDLVGFFVNTLVLRTDLAGDPTFTELVRRARATALDAYTHQEVPFDRVVEELNPTRVAGRHPLFQTMLVLQNNAETTPEFAGLAVRTGTVEIDQAKFDLAIDLTETVDPAGAPSGIVGILSYATDLWDATSAEQLAERFTATLAALLAAPDVPLSRVDTNTDRNRRGLAALNDTAVSYPDGVSLVELFERQVVARSGCVALVFEGVSVSFGELDVRVNRLANFLVALGVGRGDVVGVLVPRGVEMVVALLGVLKCGAGYVPL